MIPTLPSRPVRSPKRVRAGLFLIGWALLPGCAHLKDQGLPGRPGADRLGQASDDETSPPIGVDAFSGQVVHANPAAAGAEMASTEVAPTSAPGSGTLDLPKAGRNGPLQVSLEAPRPLPPRGRAPTVAPGSVASDPRRTAPAAARPRQAPAESKAPSSAEVMGQVVASARSRLDSLGTYQVRLNGQERIGDTLQPPEDALLSIRREPKAILLAWPEGPHQGREVLFADGPDGGLMHVRMNNALMPRVSMKPDSPMAQRNSRHPITEAGFETIIASLERSMARLRAGEPGLTYGGLQELPDVDRPCHVLREVRHDGEIWVVALDTETHLPALVQASDANGRLLERYTFRDLRPEPPELASADAFDPDARWGAQKGLFQRLARSQPGGPNAQDDPDGLPR